MTPGLFVAPDASQIRHFGTRTSRKITQAAGVRHDLRCHPVTVRLQRFAWRISTRVAWTRNS